MEPLFLILLVMMSVYDLKHAIIFSFQLTRAKDIYIRSVVLVKSLHWLIVLNIYNCYEL